MADTTKDEKTATEGLADALEAPVYTYTGYRERDDYVPNPFFQSGQVDTTDTAGTANNSIREVSPIFDVARAQNLRNAARALDPNDDGVPAELVVLPQGTVTVQGTTKTADEGREEIVNAVKATAENPVEIGGLTPSQRLAAEGDSADAKDEATASDVDGAKTEQKTPARTTKVPERK